MRIFGLDIFCLLKIIRYIRLIEDILYIVVIENIIGMRFFVELFGFLLVVFLILVMFYK